MTSSRLPTDHLWPLPVGVAAAAAIFTALRHTARKLTKWARGVTSTPLHKAPHGHAWPTEQDERFADTDIRTAYRAPWPRAPRPEHLAQTMVPAAADALAPLPERPRPGTTCDQPEPVPAGVADVPVTDAGPGTPPERCRCGRQAGHPEACWYNTGPPPPPLCDVPTREGKLCSRPAGHLADDLLHADLDKIPAAFATGQMPVVTPELLAVLDAQKEASNG